MDLLTSQFTVAYIAAALIEWLKKQSWFPFVNVDTSKLNRVFAAAVALLATVGITTTFDSEAGVLTLSGLTLGNIAQSVWIWITQYALQQGAYKGLIKPSSTEKT